MIVAYLSGIKSYRFGSFIIIIDDPCQSIVCYALIEYS